MPVFPWCSLHINSYKYEGSWWRWHPFICLSFVLILDLITLLCGWWTQVTGPKEWLTVLWVDTFGMLQVAHWSLCTSVVGLVCCWIIRRSVPVSRWCTTCTYPNAGVWLISTMPKAYTRLASACPRWCWSQNKYTTLYTHLAKAWLVYRHNISVHWTTFSECDVIVID